MLGKSAIPMLKLQATWVMGEGAAELHAPARGSTENCCRAEMRNPFGSEQV